MFNHWKDTATLPPPDEWVRVPIDSMDLAGTAKNVSEVTDDYRLIPLSVGKIVVYFPDMDTAVYYKLAYC